MAEKMTRRQFMEAAAASVAMGTAGRLCRANRAQPAEQPNFVVIFIDDMGYGDIGPFGSNINKTPNLDRMAREGMTLTSFYVAAPVCSPSRAALMTGCYPQRVGLGQGWKHWVLFPGDPIGLNPNEITIAEVLKRAGYTTGCVGKWHLGDQPQFLPTNQGFDSYFGIPYSNDMWPPYTHWQFPALPILRNTEIVDQVNTMADQATLCRRFTEEAVDFIEANREKPFFLYLPHAFVHHPRNASKEFMDKAGDQQAFDEQQMVMSSKYARVQRTRAVIEEVDWSVGRVLETLRELGLSEKTLVLFTSDNGGASGSCNLPLRGGKATIWEGGLREPTVAWWPGMIPAGTKCDDIATSMDLLPTLAALGGGKVPTDRVIDGKDIRDLLLDRPGAKSPHDRFFYYKRNDLGAVRSGPWKLFRNGQLYNLTDDIGETTNVAADHPEIVKQLTQYMDDFEAEMTKNTRPVGRIENSRTLLPRPGIEGDEAYVPTLSLPRNNQ